MIFQSLLKRNQFFRFILVGVFNTGFSYLIYAIFIALGLNYAIANLMALIAGILFSFHTQGRFVFDNTDPRLIFRFIICWGIIYIITIFAIGQFIAAGLDAYTAGFFALPISTVLSYLFQKFFVFRNTVKKKTESNASPLG